MNGNKEIWKDIEGFEGHYQISSKGRVCSLRSGCPVIMKRQMSSCGYTVNLRNGSSYKIKSVAKLVAEAFIPNPEEKKFVDFIDGKKTNCDVQNLIWRNKTERMETRSLYRQKAIHQYALDGTFLKSWNSIVEAVEELGITGISAACRGVRPAAGGYLWAYATGTDPKLSCPVIPKSYVPHRTNFSIEQRANDGKVVRIWNSVKEACEAQAFCHPENVSACLHGKRKTAYGYKWAFACRADA